jgi:peptidoglycan hydrolase CwlO-like protein
VHLIGQMKDVENKIRAREEKVHMLRREIDQGKKQQVELCQNNSALQSEIDSMNSHIRIVTH